MINADFIGFPFRLRLPTSRCMPDAMPNVKPVPLHRKIDSLMRLLPMDEILAAVPGETVMARAKACGISRQTYHYWLKGYYRPNSKQSHRLARLTGYDLDQIRPGPRP